jgi:hypothetical protein
VVLGGNERSDSLFKRITLGGQNSETICIENSVSPPSRFECTNGRPIRRCFRYTMMCLVTHVECSVIM